MRVGASIVLPVAPQAAWDRLVRWEDQPWWMADADRVEVRSGPREGAGVELAVRTRVLGVPAFTERLEVVTWEPPHRLVIAHRSFVRGTGTWELEPRPDGCTFRWVEDLHVPVAFLGELALLAYRPVMRRLLGRSLAGLRRSFG